VKFIETLISKHHITEDRTLGRPPKTAPPTRMNIPHYPSYTAATVQSKILVSIVLYATKTANVVKQDTTAKTVRWPCVLHCFNQGSTHG
jgi:hypothetical protein